MMVREVRRRSIWRSESGLIRECGDGHRGFAGTPARSLWLCGKVVLRQWSGVLLCYGRSRCLGVGDELDSRCCSQLVAHLQSTDYYSPPFSHELSQIHTS